MSDIARLVRESGMSFHLGMPHEKVIQQLGIFTEFVRAGEREACAKLVETSLHIDQAGVAAAIRARGANGP
jgi:hypothetical protein